MPRIEREQMVRVCAVGFAIVFAFAAVGTAFGYEYGLVQRPDYTDWQAIGFQLHIGDLPSFVRVAYIHYGSYAGGFIGLIAALFYVRRIASKCVKQADRIAANFTG